MGIHGAIRDQPRPEVGIPSIWVAELGHPAGLANAGQSFDGTWAISGQSEGNHGQKWAIRPFGWGTGTGNIGPGWAINPTEDPLL